MAASSIRSLTESSLALVISNHPCPDYRPTARSTIMYHFTIAHSCQQFCFHENTFRRRSGQSASDATTDFANGDMCARYSIPGCRFHDPFDPLWATACPSLRPFVRISVGWRTSRIGTDWSQNRLTIYSQVSHHLFMQVKWHYAWVRFPFARSSGGISNAISSLLLSCELAGCDFQDVAI